MKTKKLLFFTLLFLIGTKINAQDNTFTGVNCGLNNTGSYSSGYGKNSLNYNTGNYNTGFGLNSLTNNSGNYNTGFGVSSLFQNTGSHNTAFGIETLRVNNGGYNCAFGEFSLQSNDSGNLNCAFGTQSLRFNKSGVQNIAIGHRSLEANVVGSHNTSIGFASLLKNVGNKNVALGYYTPRNLLTGDSNIFIGAETGINLLHGSNNVFFGRVQVNNIPSSTFIAGNDTNSTIIVADGAGNQRLFIHKNGNTGIGLGNNVIPANRLDVSGGVVIGRNFTPKVFQDSPTAAIAPLNGLLVEGKVGIGNILPNNKVEITHGTAGNSGLRFTNLTSAYIPATTAIATKVLSVNATGDVVLQKLQDAVTTNLVSSNINLMTTTVNNIIASTNIINSISNTINSNNQLISKVNGVTSAPINLPVPTFTEIDASVTNELQTLSQTGNTITLSNGGGTFNLPTFIDTDAQSLTLTGNNLSISNGNSVILPTFTEIDASVTNELQTLSQTGNTITLSNGGGTFNLPTFTEIDASVTNELQTLSQTGNAITLSNGGGTFNLPTFTDTSIFANNGIINQATTINNNRVVDMNNSNLWFNTATSPANGKIYIGATSIYPNTTGNYKLFVEGGILTEKVKVALRSTANWADYVFADTYKLMSLKEVEQFIFTNKHLPGINSANELTKNGLDLAEMQASQMAKIEELTLYLIQQDKKVEVQNKAIEKQNIEIEELKNQMKVLIQKTK